MKDFRKAKLQETVSQNPSSRSDIILPKVEKEELDVPDEQNVSSVNNCIIPLNMWTNQKIKIEDEDRYRTYSFEDKFKKVSLTDLNKDLDGFDLFTYSGTNFKMYDISENCTFDSATDRTSQNDLLTSSREKLLKSLQSRLFNFRPSSTNFPSNSTFGSESFSQSNETSETKVGFVDSESATASSSKKIPEKLISPKITRQVSVIKNYRSEPEYSDISHKQKLKEKFSSDICEVYKVPGKSVGGSLRCLKEPKSYRKSNFTKEEEELFKPDKLTRIPSKGNSFPGAKSNDKALNGKAKRDDNLRGAPVDKKFSNTSKDAEDDSKFEMSQISEDELSEIVRENIKDLPNLAKLEPGELRKTVESSMKDFTILSNLEVAGDDNTRESDEFSSNPPNDKVSCISPIVESETLSWEPLESLKVFQGSPKSSKSDWEVDLEEENMDRANFPSSEETTDDEDDYAIQLIEETTVKTTPVEKKKSLFDIPLPETNDLYEEIKNLDSLDELKFGSSTKSTLGCDKSAVQSNQSNVENPYFEFKTQEVRHAEKTLVVRHTEGTPVVRHTEGTTVVRHTEGTTVVRHTEGTPVVRHTEKTSVVCHTEGTPVVRHTEGTPVIRHTEGTLVIRHTEGTPVIRQTEGPLDGTKHYKDTKYPSHSDYDKRRQEPKSYQEYKRMKNKERESVLQCEGSQSTKVDIAEASDLKPNSDKHPPKYDTKKNRCESKNNDRPPRDQKGRMAQVEIGEYSKSKESISPLEELYRVESKSQTGRGYGLQHFKIPKKDQSSKLQEKRAKVGSDPVKISGQIQETDSSKTNGKTGKDFVIEGKKTKATPEPKTTNKNESSDELQIIQEFKIERIIKTDENIDEPVVGEPMTKEPMADEPLADEPLADEPLADETMADETMADETIVGEPMADETIVGEPMADEPVVDEQMLDSLPDEQLMLNWEADSDPKPVSDLHVEAENPGDLVYQDEHEVIEYNSSAVATTSNPGPSNTPNDKNKVLSKDELTQEFVEVLIQKSLESGEGKYLLAQAKFLQELRKLNSKKLKTIQKIINSESDSSSSSSESSSLNEKKRKKSKKMKKRKKKKKSKKSKKLVIESSTDTSSSTSSSESEESEEEKNVKKKKPETHGSADNDKNSKKTKDDTKSTKRYPKKFSGSSLNKDQSAGPKPKLKKELDKLHADIKNMFMHSGGVATGQRMCRVLRNSGGRTDSFDTVKETAKVGKEERLQRVRKSRSREQESRSRSESRDKSQCSIISTENEYDCDEKLKILPQVMLQRVDLNNFGYGVKISDDCISFSRKRGRNMAIPQVKNVLKSPSPEGSEYMRKGVFLARNKNKWLRLNRGLSKTVPVEKKLVDVLGKLHLNFTYTNHVEYSEGRNDDVQIKPNPETRDTRRFSDSDLIKHSLQTQKTTYRCKICSRIFKNITEHYKTIHPEHGVLISRLCEREAEKARYEALKCDELSEDEKAKWKGPYTYRCRMCSSPRMTDANDFCTHVMNHTGESMFQCPVKTCNMQTTSMDEIKFHILTKHEKSRQKLYGEIAPLFPSPIEESQVFGYLCSKCNFVQLCNGNLLTHIWKQHPLDAVQIVKINMSSESPAAMLVRRMTWKCNAKSREPFHQCRKHNKKIEIMQVNPAISYEYIDSPSDTQLQELEDDKVREPLLSTPCGSPVGRASDSEEVPESTLTTPCGLPVGQVTVVSEIPEPIFLTPCGLPVGQATIISEVPEPVLPLPPGLPVGQATIISEVPEPVSPSPSGPPVGQATIISEMPEPVLSIPSGPPVGLATVISEVPEFVLPSPSGTPVGQATVISEVPELALPTPCGLPVGQATVIKEVPEPLLPTPSGPLVGLATVIKEVSEQEEWLHEEDFLMNEIEKEIVTTASTEPPSTEPPTSEPPSSSGSSDVEDEEDNRSKVIETLQVGPIKAILLENIRIYFNCRVEGCNNFSRGFETYEEHIKKCHLNLRWSGLCDICYLRVADCLLSALKHLKFHLSELDLCDQSDETVKEESVNRIMSSKMLCSPEYSSPDRPFLKVRNLTGDRLSKPKEVGGTSLVINTPENMLKIENVRSLTSGTETENNTEQAEELVSNQQVSPGKVIVVRPRQTRKIAILPENSQVAVDVGKINLVQTPVSTHSMVLSPAKAPIQLLPPLPNVGQNSVIALKPVMNTNAFKPCILTPVVSISKKPEIGESSKENRIVKPNFPFELSVSISSGVKPGTSSKSSEVLGENDYRSTVRSFTNIGSRAVKDAAVYKEMLTKKKLCHLFKCMALECSFTCNSVNLFARHIGLHEAQKRLKKRRGLDDVPSNKGTGKASQWTQCPYCCQVLYFGVDSISQHILYEHGHCTFQCAFCFYRAISQNYVQIHQDMAHKALLERNPRLIFKCKPLKDSPSKTVILEASAKKISVRPYVCELCRENFYVGEEFVEHLTFEHAAALSYRCHMCKNICFKPNRLLDHYKLHSYCTYQCAYCLHGTETDMGMLYHLCSFHSSQPAVMYHRAPSERTEARGITQLESMRVVVYDNKSINEDCLADADTDSEEENTYDPLKDSVDFAEFIAELGINSDDPTEVTPFLKELSYFSEQNTKEISVHTLLPNAKFSSENDSNSEDCSVLLSSGTAQINVDKDNNIPISQLSLDTLNVQLEPTLDEASSSISFEADLEDETMPGAIIEEIETPPRTDSQTLNESADKSPEENSDQNVEPEATEPSTSSLITNIVSLTNEEYKNQEEKSGLDGNESNESNVEKSDNLEFSGTSVELVTDNDNTEDSLPESPEVIVLEVDQSTSIETVTLNSDDELENEETERAAIEREMAMLRAETSSETDDLFDKMLKDVKPKDLSISFGTYSEGPSTSYSNERGKPELAIVKSEKSSVDQGHCKPRTRFGLRGKRKEQKRFGDEEKEEPKRKKIKKEDSKSKKEECKTKKAEYPSQKEEIKSKKGEPKSKKSEPKSKKGDPKSKKYKPKSKKGREDLKGRDLYICPNDACIFSAESITSLRDHLFVCDYSRISSVLKCPHCWKRFKQFNPFLEHIKHHGEKKYFCGLCSYSSAIDVSVIKHLKMKHKCNATKCSLKDPPHQHHTVFYPKTHKVSKFNFNESGYSPGDETKLPLQSVYEVNVKCAKCPYFTKVRSNMVRHLNIHLKSAETEGLIVPSSAPMNPVPCLEAKEKMFDKMTNLAASSQLAQSERERKIVPVVSAEMEEKFPQYVAEQFRFKCCMSDCKYITVDAKMLKHHIRALHNETTHYSCPHCKNTVDSNMRIVWLDKLGNHLKFHDVRLYKCGYCLYVHYQKLIVEKHMNEKHADEVSSGGRCLVQIVRDMRSQGEDETFSGCEAETIVYKCTQCEDVESVLKSKVREHLINDHKIKAVHQCRMCSMTGSGLKTFAHHFAAKHPGEKVSFFPLINEQKVPSSSLRKSSEHFDTTPLWQRGARRVRHIRGILVEEEEVKTKRRRRSSSEKREKEPAKQKGNSKLYFCPLCSDKVFSTKSEYVFRTHLYRELNYHQFVCILCGKMFIKKKDYLRHHAKMHPGRPPVLSYTKEDREIMYWVDKVIEKQVEEMNERTRKSSDSSADSLPPPPPPKKKKNS